MIFYGTTHRVGDRITIDEIIAAEHHASADPAVLAAYCLAAVDPSIAEHARDGDILLAGRDFGVGEACDSAVLALRAAGFVAVVCSSAEPAFDKTAQVYGLPILVCPEAVANIAAGSVVRLDLAGGRIEDRTTGIVYSALPCAPELTDAVRRAQLLARMRQVVDEEGFDG